ARAGLMPKGITRRELLGLALASPLLAASVFGRAAQGAKVKRLDMHVFADAPGRVVPVIETADISQIKLTRQWRGPFCRAQAVNLSWLSPRAVASRGSSTRAQRPCRSSWTPRGLN